MDYKYSGIYENKSAYSRISHQTYSGFDNCNLLQRIKTVQSLVRLDKNQKKSGETLIADNLKYHIKSNCVLISVAYLDRSNGYRI